MTTPTDPTTPTTPGTQTAADVGHTASANGSSVSDSAAPAAEGGLSSPEPAPAVAQDLRERLAAAIYDSDEVDGFTAYTWDTDDEDVREPYRRNADASLPVFADWLRGDEAGWAIVHSLGAYTVTGEKLVSQVLGALADLIDATVERSANRAPVAAGATPPVGASTAGRAHHQSRPGPPTSHPRIEDQRPA